ncbi:MAG TPA: hypothetical protein PK668_22925 [Myxococcota bacterium]|nr:hypothetical protein [Myxococcota bacterium]HRY95549.1 hypothetical protein [Myxococcota bacterium]HSA21698.1 hypothetical protein [Myxococcota bacterium]
MAGSHPKLRPGLDFTALDLSADAAEVAPLLDGRLSVDEVAQVAGLPRARVEALVSELGAQGALAPASSLPSLAVAEDDDPTAETPVPPVAPAGAGPRAAARTDEQIIDERPIEEQPTEEPPSEEPLPPAEAATPEAPDEETPQAAAALARKLANFRQLYETQFHPLPVDARVALAKQASAEVLSALCLDPEPPVVRAVMENALAGLDQARLIAEHHRNPVGLEAVVARAELGRDAQVRRLLLRNNQASDIILRRVLSPLPLAKLFQVNLSRENTERAKRLAREVFRRRWQQAQGEETAGLVFQTEGRCLLMLIGLHLDQAATAFLSRRTYTSSLLVQNLARFPATPPGLIKHLFHQAIVRRAPHLKKLLTQHPNCPAEVKYGR